MHSRHNGFETLYDDQVAAYRQLYAARENTPSSFKSSSIILSVLVLLVTLLVKFYSPDGTFEGVVSPLANFLWDTLIFIVPAPLLFAVDNWFTSSAPRPMLNTQQSSHAAKSEAMRRVMGSDRLGGMMSSVFQARNRALSMTGLKTETNRPPGLGNRDNSCYQNSILQGLASLHSISDYLSSCIRGIEATDEAVDKNIAHTLRSLIANLNDVSNYGRTLWTPGLLKSMSTWTQQDAQEYYSKILDDIDKGAAAAAKSMALGQMMGLVGGDSGKNENSPSEHSDDSGYQSRSSCSKAKPMRNPLEGLLAQRVVCVQCGHSDGLSMIPFNCLTLSLGLDKIQHDLYDRLDAYSKVEMIEGVDCLKCTLLKVKGLLSELLERMAAGGSTEEQLAEPLRRLEAVKNFLEEDEFDEETISNACKITAQGRVSTTKTKQMVIARPPKSLVIHVNRSVFDPSTLNMIKNSAPVNFPMMLDLGPWCLGSAEERANSDKANSDNASSGGFRASEEQWQLDPMASMIAGDLEPSRLTGPIYELRAAVTHYGRHENGHYICYRKYPLCSSPSSKALDERDAASSRDVTAGDMDDTNAEASTGKVKHPSSSAHGDGEMGWWRLSDHNVSRVDEDVIMSLSPGVFMLFYECVDPSMILQSEAADEIEGALEASDAKPEASTVSNEDKTVAPKPGGG